MSNIRISVVLATFNGANYVDAQIRSVLPHLNADDEIVVSDDGSKDSTVEIVRSIFDQRIRILENKENLGYQRNFQRAISASRGSYILFCDQDDICLAARIPRSLEALQQYGCVCGDAAVVDQDLNELFPSFFDIRKAKFGFAQLVLRPAVIGATMACRREFIFDSLPFPKGVPHDLWLSILAVQKKQLCIIQEPFILYRRHNAVVSSTSSSVRRKLRVIIAERFRLLGSLMFRRVFKNDKSI